MMDILILLFFQNGLVCVHEQSIHELAQAFIYEREISTPFCGTITGTVTPVRQLPYVYFYPSGLGMRLMEGTYRGVRVYYFKMEYAI